MATPQTFYTGVFSTSGATGESVWFTASISIPQAFEAFIPVKYISPTNLSAGAECWAFRSMDGGTTYETTFTTSGTLVGVFSPTGGTTMIKNINLPRGTYLIGILSGGAGVAATFSFQWASTVEIVTAYS